MFLKEYCRLYALVAIASMAACAAEQHVVGGDRGWDPFSDFRPWASGKTFRVGDNLWFAYPSTERSVIELRSREEWDACDIGNPLRMYTEGLNSVRLSEVGTRYFTSGRVEDCQDGMKLHVNVVSGGDEINDGKDNNGGTSPLSSSSSSSSSSAVNELMIDRVMAEGPTTPGYAPPMSSVLTLWVACFMAFVLWHVV